MATDTQQDALRKKLRAAIFAIPDEHLISRDIIIHAVESALAAQPEQPVAWVTRAALRHWETQKVEGAHQYTFLPKDDNQLGANLRVPLYASPQVRAEQAAVPQAIIDLIHAGDLEPILYRVGEEELRMMFYEARHGLLAAPQPPQENKQ